MRAHPNFVWSEGEPQDRVRRGIDLDRCPCARHTYALLDDLRVRCTCHPQFVKMTSSRIAGEMYMLPAIREDDDPAHHEAHSTSGDHQQTHSSPAGAQRRTASQDAIGGRAVHATLRTVA